MAILLIKFQSFEYMFSEIYVFQMKQKKIILKRVAGYRSVFKVPNVRKK